MIIRNTIVLFRHKNPEVCPGANQGRGYVTLDEMDSSMTKQCEFHGHILVKSLTIKLGEDVSVIKRKKKPSLISIHRDPSKKNI
ncbi:hypothetical protein GCM10010965_21410 [Caldalkalibacillus thermarum]|nr:hypothetical protein GCM10010965_21410 [Caldalkalibacillus thermarum]